MDNKEKAEGEDISKNKSPLVVDNQNPIAEETYTKEISKVREEFFERFENLETKLSSLENLSQANLKETLERSRKEDEYWDTLTDMKDDYSKKAINAGMWVLLAIAVGLLIPYFKSEKLKFVDYDYASLSPRSTERGDILSTSSLSQKSQANKGPEQQLYVTLKFVNLRIDPEPKSKILETLAPNIWIKKIDEKGSWVKVQFFDHFKNEDKVGWVFNELVKKAKVID